MLSAVTGAWEGQTKRAEVRMIQRQLMVLITSENGPRWNGPRWNVLRATVRRRAMGIRYASEEAMVLIDTMALKAVWLIMYYISHTDRVR